MRLRGLDMCGGDDVVRLDGRQMQNMAAKKEMRKAREGIYSCGGRGHAGGWHDNKAKKAGRDGDG